MAQPQKKVQRTIDIWKKKRWYKLVAPALFNNEVLGESPALDAGVVEKRTITANLMTLTRDMKKQHVDVTFEVNKIQGDSAFTEFKRYEINPTFIKRSVRRNRSRVDDSFAAITADGWKLQVKPFLLTRFATPKSITTALRKKTRDFIIRAIAKNTRDTILHDVVSMKLQRLLRDAVKNIYNLRSCEIRVLDVLGPTTEKPPVFADDKKEAKEAEEKEESGNEVKEKAVEKNNEALVAAQESPEPDAAAPQEREEKKAKLKRESKKKEQNVEKKEE